MGTKGLLAALAIVSFSSHASLSKEDRESIGKDVAIGAIVKSAGVGSSQRERSSSDIITGVNLTGYSAACKADPWGGPNKSSWGRVKPRSHTLDGKAELNTVEVAAPQFKGTASLFGCYLEFDFSQSNVPKEVRKLFEGKRIFAADHYSTSSNGKRKFDISLECTSYKNINSFNYTGVRVRKAKCLGTGQVAQARGLEDAGAGGESRTASADPDASAR